MTIQNSNDIEWWNELALRLNGYQGNYKVNFVGLNGEVEFTNLVKDLLRDHPNTLDVGCADGRFAIDLSSFASRVTAIDLSPVMIEAAKKSTKAPNLEFIVCDAKEMPFSDNSFDLVISRRGPVSEPVFLEEAIRVTKPMGKIIEITIGERDAIEFKDVFNRGQGYLNKSKSRYLEIRNRLELNSEIKISQIHEYFCDAYYPSIEDVALLLSSTPIIDDFNIESDLPLLRTIETEYHTNKGIRRTYHRIIWIAEKL
ncbi:class I SAM-dependent methyltransferase [Paenibacillus sediminis]|uniref:SAM-dependent methyltransferase n=1 Tax=Paenibacillus sediminis TaxID=664909 RepID=A0ABS4H821_9BACL|nr:class I SAM-dependent methyltransferase [Paenibacillus sediminis]MBP1938685.1 SAM-dependent methyltransferase [Paenibacillus sediminis]